MEPVSTLDNQQSDLDAQSAEVVGDASGYGLLIVNGLDLIACGMTVICS